MPLPARDRRSPPAQSADDGAVPARTRDDLDVAVRAVVADATLHQFVYQPDRRSRPWHDHGLRELSRFVGARHPPDLWFAAADRLGVGPRLQARVLQQGIRMVAQLPPDTFLTINLDPRLIACDEVARVIADAGSLARIVIELTEQTVSDDPGGHGAPARTRSRGGSDDRARRCRRRLRRAADPSRGATPLVTLDRSLVAGLDRDPARRALVSTIGDLAGRLDSWVLAEGIETLAELRAVIDLGVPLGQGYGLERPAAELVTQLADSARRAIVSRAGAREFVHTLAPLMEVVRAVPSADEARELALADAAVHHVVQIDDHATGRAVVAATSARGCAGGARWRATSSTGTTRWCAATVAAATRGSSPSSGTVAIPCVERACDATCPRMSSTVAPENVALQPGTTSTHANCFITTSGRPALLKRWSAAQPSG